MLRMRIGLFAAAAIGWAFLGITGAAAGGCCYAARDNCGCGSYRAYAPQRFDLQPAPSVYLVDQGPYYSGPGPDYRKSVYYPDQALRPYPYISGRHWWRHHDRHHRHGHHARHHRHRGAGW